MTENQTSTNNAIPTLDNLATSTIEQFMDYRREGFDEMKLIDVASDVADNYIKLFGGEPPKTQAGEADRYWVKIAMANSIVEAIALRHIFSGE